MNSWIQQINNINNSFLSNKQHIISLLTLTKKKRLLCVNLKLDKKIISLLNNDCILIWDCEFQKWQDKYGVSELGCIILFNINNNIYLVALIHASFMNRQMCKELGEYYPFYHDYMTTTKKTETKILNIEKQIYPHLMFEEGWNKYLSSNNINHFKKILHQILKLNFQNKSAFKKHVKQLMKDKNDEKLLKKIKMGRLIFTM